MTPTVRGRGWRRTGAVLSVVAGVTTAFVPKCAKPNPASRIGLLWPVFAVVAVAVSIWLLGDPRTG